jgi:hypothetical protein
MKLAVAVLKNDQFFDGFEHVVMPLLDQISLSILCRQVNQARGFIASRG